MKKNFPWNKTPIHLNFSRDQTANNGLNYFLKKYSYFYPTLFDFSMLKIIAVYHEVENRSMCYYLVINFKVVLQYELCYEGRWRSVKHSSPLFSHFCYCFACRMWKKRAIVVDRTSLLNSSPFSKVHIFWKGN